jgi:hypothetical protein
VATPARMPGISLRNATREDAEEVSRTHGNAAGEGGDVQLFARMVSHPGLEVAQRLALGRLRRELHAHLRLAPRALEEEDEAERHCVRDPSPEILLDKSQDEIHARRATGGGVNTAIADVDRLRIDRDTRVAMRELLAERPVCCGPPAVEEASLGQKERAAAEAGDASAAPSGAAQPGEETLVTTRQIEVVERSDDQCVDRPVDGRI